MVMYRRTLVAIFSLGLVAFVFIPLFDMGYEIQAYVLFIISSVAIVAYQIVGIPNSLTRFAPTFLRPKQTVSGYRRQGLDTARADGDRPYKRLDDETLKQEYADAVSTVRNADEGGFHLSPTIDRGWLLREEWIERDNDVTELSRTDTNRETGDS